MEEIIYLLSATVFLYLRDKRVEDIRGNQLSRLHQCVCSIIYVFAKDGENSNIAHSFVGRSFKSNCFESYFMFMKLDI